MPAERNTHMRPERVFGATFNFSNAENAQAFLAHATRITAPYARFVEISLVGTQVRVIFKIDSIGKEIVEGLNAQLMATANSLA